MTTPSIHALEAETRARKWAWVSEDPIAWVALRCRVQAEIDAENVLARFGVRASALSFLRWRQANKYHRRKKRLDAKILMPGIVWANLPASVNWVHLGALSPVTGVVSPHGKPLALRDDQMGQMHAIAARLCQKPHHAPMPTNRVFDIGDMAEFLEGPLEGLQVSVRSLDGRTARVITSMFGVEREIATDVATLGKVG